MNRPNARRKFLTAVLAVICSITTLNFTCTSSQLAWATTAEGIATVVVDGAGAAVSIADPAAAPLITGIEAGFGALVKALQSYQANQNAGTLAGISAALNTANSDVAAFEVGVKNAKTSAEIQALVPVFTQAISEIATLIPAPVANAGLANPQAVKSRAKGWTKKDFKKQFNAVFKNDARIKPLK